MSDWTCAGCGGVNPVGTRFCGHCGAAASAAPPAAAVTETLRSFVAASVAERLEEEGGRLQEERRLITALFADVSGFTPLADRLDPEELLEVIDPVITALSSIVGRYEGFVEKFAGDALLALFGAPVSHEDDADRALLVALEMHRTLAQLCKELPHDASGLTLHVGVNSGHGVARLIGSSVRTDYGVLGDSVILAQRLEAAAPAGETYVSDATYRLTSKRFEFEPAGELTLKGKAEPVRAWRLVGQRVGARRAGTALVGRTRELDLLRDRIRSLAGGTSATIALVGEPGIGKSRLVDAARAAAVDSGARWLEARCLSYGVGLPYWPIADLLRREADLDGTHAEDVVLARLGEMLPVEREDIRLVGGLLGVATPAEDVEPEALRRRVHAAVIAWVEALAKPDGVVVAVEDVHWADSATAALLAEIARSRARGVLVLLTGRPEARELLAPLEHEALDLEHLAMENVAELVAALLGAPAPAQVVEFIARRSGGNPFFVGELVRALQERGALLQDGGRWVASSGWDTRDLPATIEEVLAARIDRLPRAAAELLQTASVVGRRVRLSLLRAVAGDGCDAAAIAQLVASGFFERDTHDGDDAVVFHHALVQDVAYTRLLRRQRRELHARVAAEAERMYGAGDDTVDLLARHLYLAGAGAKAAEFLMRAGRRAQRLYANDEAILHFSRALELMPERVDVALELAELHELVGNFDAAMEQFEHVRAASGDVRAWRGIVAVHRKRGEYADALATVSKAFQDEPLAGADLRPIWLEGAWALSVAGRFDDAIDYVNAGLEAGGRRDDPLAGRLLFQLARAERVEGRLDDAVVHAFEAVEVFERHEDPRGLASALRLLGDSLVGLGRFDEASAQLTRGLAAAERVGNVEEVGGCLINLGLVELRRGDLDAAIHYDRRAIEEFERIGLASGRAVAYANLADMLVQTGEYDEARLFCEQALALARETGNLLVVADATQVEAAMHLQLGEYAQAAADAEAAARLFVEIGAEPYAAGAFEMAARALAAAGDEERATAPTAEARSFA